MSSSDAVRTFCACFAATMVLTGCGRDEPPPTAAIPAAAMPELRWVEIRGEEGAGLSLLGEGDRQLMHIACLGEPGRIEVIGRGFQKLRSEDRLMLRVDEEVFALAADLEAETPGVMAAGALEPALIDDLGASRALSLVYAGQRAGPYEAPTREVMARFTATCRGLAGGEPA